ncbi:hypothetical protein IWQ54_002270 [Labrenzia sp. EL_195]|nr:hypothetical protein [Labrenzia sp. EL_195]
MKKTHLNLTAKEIASELSNGDAIFYVGAGFSMIAGMPSWSHLLEELIDKLEANARRKTGERLRLALNRVTAAREAKEQSEYQYVASIVSMGLDKNIIADHVAKRFTSIQKYPDETKKRIENRVGNLLKAPVAGIITTNYDNLIECHSTFSKRFSNVALSSIDLPSLFRGKDRTKRFFVKIHGDLNGEIVLSSEDYDRVYLSSPRVVHFLRACLMQNPIAFLGCSIEDSVLRQRRMMFELYGDGLPPCFQITSRSAASEVRAGWLYEYAGIRTVFYDSSSIEHLEFDTLFEELTSEMIKQNLQSFGRRPSRIIHEALLAGETEYDENSLGKTNFEIIKIVHAYPGNSCTYLQLLEDLTVNLPRADLESMVYRIAFLVSVGALQESGSQEIILSVPN